MQAIWPSIRQKTLLAPEKRRSSTPPPESLSATPPNALKRAHPPTYTLHIHALINIIMIFQLVKIVLIFGEWKTEKVTGKFSDLIFHDAKKLLGIFCYYLEQNYKLEPGQQINLGISWCSIFSLKRGCLETVAGAESSYRRPKWKTLIKLMNAPEGLMSRYNGKYEILFSRFLIHALYKHV